MHIHYTPTKAEKNRIMNEIYFQRQNLHNGTNMSGWLRYFLHSVDGKLSTNGFFLSFGVDMNDIYNHAKARYL